MNPAATPSAAYLEAIFEMQEETIPTQQARIAEWLGVTPASVSEAVKRLTRDGLVILDGRELRFTPAGAGRGRSLIRRRRLAEVFFVQSLGLPWHRAREESSPWERAISEDVEERMRDLLADPTTCPHGNPIPGAPASTRAEDAVISLTTALPDGQLVLERLTEDRDLTPEVLLALEDAGLLPGASIRVLQTGPDGAMSLLAGDRATTLAADIADNLWVSRPSG